MTVTIQGLPGRGKVAVVVIILLIIALAHIFRIGSYLQGSMYALYYSYFSDIVIPFGMYFLLCLDEAYFRFLRDWRVKSGLVFAVAAGTEVAQAFGVPILGQTFDPLDFAMFAIGVLLAAFVDRWFFARFFPFWLPKVGDSYGNIRQNPYE
jgi:hypothetical protein